MSLSFVSFTEAVAKARHEAQEEVRRLYQSMAGSIQPHTVYILAAMFHKAFECLFDRVIVEETQMQKLKHVVQTASGPVMLLPTHRSYMVWMRALRSKQ